MPLEIFNTKVKMPYESPCYRKNIFDEVLEKLYLSFLNSPNRTPTNDFYIDSKKNENLTLLHPVCRSALCKFIIQKFRLGLNFLNQ